METQNKYH
jgi:serine/threonine protein phosphatase PrpC